MNQAIEAALTLYCIVQGLHSHTQRARLSMHGSNKEHADT